MKRTKQAPPIERKAGPFTALPDSPIKNKTKELQELSWYKPPQEAVLFVTILANLESSIPKLTNKEKETIKKIVSFHVTKKIDPLLSKENKENLNTLKSSPQTSTENLLLCFSKNLPIDQKLLSLLTGVQQIRDIYQNLLDLNQCKSDAQARETLAKNFTYVTTNEQLQFFTVCILHGFEIPLQRIAQHNQLSLRESPIISVLEICFKEKQANALNEIIKLYEIMLKNEDKDCLTAFTSLLFSNNELKKDSYNATGKDAYPLFISSVFNFIKYELISLARSLEIEEDFISFLRTELYTKDQTLNMAAKECLNTIVTLDEPKNENEELNTSDMSLKSENLDQSLDETISYPISQLSLADELAQLDTSFRN